MGCVDPAGLWSLHYRLTMSVIVEIAPAVAALGLEIKELFMLTEIDEHSYPAELAETLCMPRPTVTTNLKRLEAAGFVRREIDPADLRRHRLVVTPEGRRVMQRGVEVLDSAFGARLGRLTAAQQTELHALLAKLS